jgi:mRNA interferase MazF
LTVSAPFRADIRRGELYWLDWSPARGSEQSGRRPALIIGSDAANQNGRYPLTIVVAISTTQRNVLTHVTIEPDTENGLHSRSSIKCEQVMTVSKDRLLTRIGRLVAADLARVEVALKRALGLS